ncbi:SirB1 family protein [Niveispirillum sp.]|uniref:SirB1 family protein n=1 Tax=Niveispirillum sp. TaxID=1917217 RepID=UPI001B61EFE2|nr:transglutaminase-like domain-containing protein [Niveispirillum sp.]MBP7334609.1 transglutaminase family protein [Niveispirillum sp.]
MTPRQQALDYLRRLGTVADDEIDVGEAALALAVLDHPADLTTYRAHLAQLGSDLGQVMQAVPDALAERVGALGRLLEMHSYAGDSETYEDLQNANLVRVIDRRRGLPVSLGILLISAARSLGWDILGLNFPGHFLLRLDHAGGRQIIDPFSGAIPLGPRELRDMLKQTAGIEAELTPDHYAPVSNREVLLRLQNNLKLRHLSTDQPDKALAVIEDMLLFAPEHIGLWRESGLLNAHLGNLTAGIAAFETFLRIGEARGASPQLLDHTRTLLRQLRGRLN